MKTDHTARAAIHERISQLAARFLQRCVDETAVMQDHAMQIRASIETHASLVPRELESLRQLEHLAHKIHGTAASFGHAALSERGGEIERLAESLLNGERRLDAVACTALDRCIAQLSEELHAIAAEQGRGARLT
jgi:HPt (histidine-containing phosphotransfer) domain-containing protein